ncbi:coiled-coil domain protein [Trypanosoma rangeli]|uniref:Coiled-coil domain protein n=1 Tax=Trypanosoma rangeli TaxID=5698 RepID=A0A3R7KG47_TRYRA|nr:coiled-coil domain protein [Trypanosoma rangeli]RNF05808.1 coiled-coil domain protein [Trypanosoma rangeli]|eukprot:RNF05808.1 coiled-coil domain protein [Trypanosoma rangeli]
MMVPLDEEREQRIAERRRRVQERLKKMSDINSDVHVAVGADHGMGGRTGSGEAKGIGEESVRNARRDMAEALSCAHSAVTSWEVEVGKNENERRVREERLIDERRQRRREELEANEIKQGAIELKFEAIHKINAPHELQKSLEQQQQQCKELLGAKDRLIEALRGQLEEREEEFVAALRRNTADVNSLVAEMREQTERYLDDYTNKLREVEGAYEKERMEYLSHCDEELLQLMKLRRTRETEYRKKREDEIVQAQQKMDDKHRENCEEYNEIKREHLEEIHALMEELERCKAEFLLNGERLSYNLQVLRERVKENKSAQAMHKRKLARLQDTLSYLVARYAESEKKYQRSNKDLTAQLHRVANQYRDLQKKFQRFERSDKEKYQQIWAMHEEKNIQLAFKSLQADRVLFEEILGVPWNPPQLNYWPEDDVADTVEDNEEEAVSSDDEIELSEEALMLLALLHKQAPFISDETVYAAIRQVQDVTEERAVVESILSALQVHKDEEMSDLLEYFMVDGPDETRALIRPQEAVRALSTFLTERQRERKQQEEGQKESAKRNKELTRMKLEERRRVAEKEYWLRMASSVPKEHQRVWGALEKGLKLYIAQLQQRKTLIEGTDSLRAQNAELRGLLMQYLQSDVNYQLYIPPKLLLQARAAS